MPQPSNPPRLDPERPFVGRDSELEVLLAAFAAAGHGGGSVVTLDGAAGMGKTRLADELANHARNNATVCWSRAWEDDGAPPYWPWIQLIRAVAATLDPATLPLRMGVGAPVLAHLVPELRRDSLRRPAPLRPAQARFRLFDSIVSFVRAVAAERPLLLILEDIHAYDEPSLLALEFLGQEITRDRILVVATHRPATVKRAALSHAITHLGRIPSCRHITLQGLEVDAVARLIELTTGERPAAALVARIHQVTQGNPFFIHEMIPLLAGMTPPFDSPAPHTVPESIYEAVDRRLAVLSDRCRHLLGIATVVGGEFTHALLARVACRSSGSAALSAAALRRLVDEALAAGVLTDDDSSPDRYRFSHVLLRDRLYGKLAPSERARHHRRVGAAFETLHRHDLTPCLAQLAHHFYHGAVSGYAPKAIDYSIRAAQHANVQLAYEDAVLHYQRASHALELWDPSDGPRRCDLLLALGEAQTRAGESEATRAHTFARAAALAQGLADGERLARAALGITARRLDRPVDPALATLVTRALTALPPGDGSLRVRLLSERAIAQASTDTNDAAMRSVQDAVEMARRLADPATIAHALNANLALLWGPEDPPRRLALATEIVSLAEEARDREMMMMARAWRIGDLLALGDVAAVRREIATYGELAKEMRQPFFQWWHTTQQVTLAHLAGQLADAHRLALAALQLGQRACPRDAEQVFAGEQFHLLRDQQRMDELETSVRAIVERFPFLPACRCALALLYAEQGRTDCARRELDQILSDGLERVPRDTNWLLSIAMLGDVVTVLGDERAASSLYEALRSYDNLVIVSGPGTICFGAAARVLGQLAALLGYWDAAMHHFEQALAISQRIAAPVWLARTQLAYATALATRRCPDDAARTRQLLDEARAASSTFEIPAIATKVAPLVDASPPLATAQARGSYPDSAPAASTLQTVSPSSCVLRKEGDYWLIAAADVSFRLKHSIGLSYLATLLSRPGREMLAADLLMARNQCPTRHRMPSRDIGLTARTCLTDGDGGAVLDAAARLAYGRRIAELREVIAEAEAFNDLGRSQAAAAEIDAISEQLAAAVGLGGRSRRLGSTIERARLSVTRAIHLVIRRITLHDAALGRYLATTVKTGTYCSYTPDPRIPLVWQL